MKKAIFFLSFDFSYQVQPNSGIKLSTGIIDGLLLYKRPLNTLVIPMTQVQDLKAFALRPYTKYQKNLKRK